MRVPFMLSETNQDKQKTTMNLKSAHKSKNNRNRTVTYSIYKYLDIYI